jgi:hypothetical protein
VIKRKVSFGLILTLVVAGLILAMLPAAAVAAPGIVEVNWSEAAFEGNDAFYGGVAVVAYKAGSTAKMEFRVRNDSAVDLKITGGTVNFDWGSCSPVSPTVFPFVLKALDYAIFRFECVVPADATNQTLHSYRAIVTYEGDNGAVKVNEVYWENVAGGGVTYALLNAPIVPDSEVIYLEDTTANIVTPLALNSGYALNDYTGVITFTAAPTANVRAKYKYCEDVITGDGSTLVGYLNNVPVVPGSVVVCLEDSVAETVTLASTGYTVDSASGKVTMVTAPTSWQTVTAYYNYYGAFTSTGANLAVVSVDQADYTTLWRRYMETTAAPPGAAIYASSSALQLRSEADAARAKAEIQYREGDFAGAKASMQIALDKFNASIAAQSALFGSVESGVMGLLTGAGGAVDAYGAKLNAEAKNITDTTKAETNKLNGEADMAKNLGVFYIMLGVATLLAGIGGILWAYSRLVAAKGPKQI